MCDPQVATEFDTADPDPMALVVRAARDLLKAVGRSGWQSSPPTFSERKDRAELMNELRSALESLEA